MGVAQPGGLFAVMFGAISLILGLVTFVIGMNDVIWHLRYPEVFPPSQTRWRQCLLYSSLFALFNGLAGVLPLCVQTLNCWMTVCRVMWIIHMMQAGLGVFNLGTLAAWPGQAVLCWQHDSTTEALEVGPLVTESAESAHSCFSS